MAAADVQRDAFARGQSNGSQLRDDDTLVAHLGCHQGNVAAQPGFKRRPELPFIHHRTGAAKACKGIFTRHEVGVADAVRGGHQCTHVDRRAPSKIHTAGVDQKNLPVGCDAPQYFTGLASKHPVERDRRCAGL